MSYVYSFHGDAYSLVVPFNFISPLTFSYDFTIFINSNMILLLPIVFIMFVWHFQVFHGRRLKIGYSENWIQFPTDRPDAILCGRLELCTDEDVCYCYANHMRLFKLRRGLHGSGRGHRTGGKNGDGAGNDYSSPDGSFGTSSAGGGSYSGSGNFGSAGGVGCHDT